MTINWKPAIQSTEGPLYLAIARALAEDIAAGRLSEGDKLPTQRDLAEELAISLGTVTRAYAEAEKRELIRSEGRRGTFVGADYGRRRREVGLARLILSERRLIDLGVNFPTRGQDPPLAPALKAIAASADMGELLRYPDPQGLERHRRAGVRWLELLGISAEADELLVTAGGQNALFLTLAALTRPGQTVLAEEVTYPGFKGAAQRLGLEVKGVAVDNQGLIPQALERLCRDLEFTNPVRALYCMPDLQNPTSAIMPAERRRELVDIAERFDLALIEDAIQRPLLDSPPPALACLAPERTWCLASTSKTVAAGLRVGFIKAPAYSMADLVAMSEAVNLMGSPLTVEVLARWLEDGTAWQTVLNRRQEARTRQAMLKRHLGRFDLQSHPASYYGWLRLEEEADAPGLALAAHRRGVAVAPSEVFSADDGPVHPAVRICPGTPDDIGLVEAALEILAGLLDKAGPDLSVLM